VGGTAVGDGAAVLVAAAAWTWVEVGAGTAGALALGSVNARIIPTRIASPISTMTIVTVLFEEDFSTIFITGIGGFTYIELPRLYTQDGFIQGTPGCLKPGYTLDVLSQLLDMIFPSFEEQSD
jgi:hypothetical protein